MTMGENSGARLQIDQANADGRVSRNRGELFFLVAGLMVWGCARMQAALAWVYRPSGLGSGRAAGAL
jgi:hypothetical protein